MGRRAADRRGGARAAAGACWKRSAAAPPARATAARPPGSRMLIWERRGHARDRRLRGLLNGLLGGMSGGGEEDGGLHGACDLLSVRRATCRSHVLVGGPRSVRAYRVRASWSVSRGGGRDLSAGTVGLPSGSQAAHPHSRAPPPTPSPRPPAGERTARRTRKHDTGLTTQLGRRNEEGPLFPQTPVFRPLGSHRRVHSFRREAARPVGVEGAHHQR